MGQKTSKMPSKTTPKKSSTHENDFAMYLLPNNEEVTLATAQLEVAAYGRNAVILFPDPSDASSSSSGSRKYKASFIRDGRWMGSAGIRQEVSIGSRNFSDAKFSALPGNPIQLILPTTPNYQNLLNTTLAFGGIQSRESKFDKLEDVIHTNIMAPQHDNKTLTAVKTGSRRLHGLYKPEDRKRTVKKLLEHAVCVEAKDIKEIKRILDAPLKQKPPNFEYLRELLCGTGTEKHPLRVKDPFGRVHENRTVYQIALGAREYNVTSEKGVQVVDGLIEMLGEYFKKLPDGETIRKQQYDAQFPEGFEATEKARAANDSREFKRVMEVVGNSSDATCQQTMALDGFHGIDLRPSSWAANDNEVLASAIYLQETAAGLNCRYRGLDGQVKNKHISWDRLPGVPRSAAGITAAKATYLPAILDELAEPGQFYTAEQIQELKKLSQTTVTACTLETFNDAWGELRSYLQGIVGEAVDLTVLNALYQLRNHLEPKGVYTTGYHANSDLPREAYQSYDNNFSQFGNNWSSPKNVLCAQKIVGLSQVRGLTAGELQLHAQGLYDVLVGGAKSKHSFSYTYGGGSSRPDVSDLCFRLGYNCFAQGAGGLSHFGRRAGGGGAWGGRGFYLKLLCRAKTSAQQNYAATWQSIDSGPRDNVTSRNNS